MVIRCPTCGRVLPMDDVNVARDLALCRACDQTHRFADLVDEACRPSLDPANPPRGTWLEETFDGFRVGATTRHPVVLALFPVIIISLLFASLSFIFVSGSVKGQVGRGSVLFGLFLLAMTVIFAGSMLMAVCGRVEVRVVGEEGEVFSGVGPFGSRRRFRWSTVDWIEEGFEWYSNLRQMRVIRLVGDRLVTFGAMLNEPRRYYLIQTLRRMKSQPKTAIKPAGSLDLD